MRLIIFICLIQLINGRERKPLIPYPLHDYVQVNPAAEEIIRSLIGPGYFPDSLQRQQIIQPNYYSNAIYQQQSDQYKPYYQSIQPNSFPGYFSLNGGNNENNDGFSLGSMPNFQKSNPELVNSFVMDGDNGEYLIEQQVVTQPTTPGWTRATTTKDRLVAYLEQTLDKFLTNGFSAIKRVPLSNYLEEESLLPAVNKKV